MIIINPCFLPVFFLFDVSHCVFLVVIIYHWVHNQRQFFSLQSTYIHILFYLILFFFRMFCRIVLVRILVIFLVFSITFFFSLTMYALCKNYICLCQSKHSDFLSICFGSSSLIYQTWWYEWFLHWSWTMFHQSLVFLFLYFHISVILLFIHRLIFILLYSHIIIFFCLTYC
jgi:hypothetical protein